MVQLFKPFEQILLKKLLKGSQQEWFITRIRKVHPQDRNETTKKALSSFHRNCDFILIWQNSRGNLVLWHQCSSFLENSALNFRHCGLAVPLWIGQGVFEGFKGCFSVQSQMIGMLYTKSLRLHSAACSRYGTGTIVNLQSNDATKLYWIPLFMHSLWSAPIQVSKAATFSLEFSYDLIKEKICHKPYCNLITSLNLWLLPLMNSIYFIKLGCN